MNVNSLPCAGCGILHDVHPFVAVMMPADVPADVPMSAPGPQGFVSVPVCAACHQDPAHRRRPIKGHFFAATSASRGVGAAGRNAITG